MGVSTVMTRCACGHPVKAQWPKGSTPPVVKTCRACDEK
jgi:hypothetical protein